MHNDRLRLQKRYWYTKFVFEPFRKIYAVHSRCILRHLLEILLHLEMREIRQGATKLEVLIIESDDPRMQARLQACTVGLIVNFASVFSALSFLN